MEDWIRFYGWPLAALLPALLLWGRRLLRADARRNGKPLRRTGSTPPPPPSKPQFPEEPPGYQEARRRFQELRKEIADMNRQTASLRRAEAALSCAATLRALSRLFNGLSQGAAPRAGAAHGRAARPRRRRDTLTIRQLSRWRRRLSKKLKAPKTTSVKRERQPSAAAGAPPSAISSPGESSDSSSSFSAGYSRLT